MAFVLSLGLGGAGGVLGGVGTGTGYPIGGEIITFSNIQPIKYTTTFIPVRQQHDVPQYMSSSKLVAKHHSLKLDVSRDWHLLEWDKRGVTCSLTLGFIENQTWLSAICIVYNGFIEQAVRPLKRTFFSLEMTRVWTREFRQKGSDLIILLMSLDQWWCCVELDRPEWQGAQSSLGWVGGGFVASRLRQVKMQPLCDHHTRTRNRAACHQHNSGRKIHMIGVSAGVYMKK